MTLMTNGTIRGGRGAAAKRTPAKAVAEATNPPAAKKAAAKKTPAKKATKAAKPAAAAPPPAPAAGWYDVGGVPMYWDGTAWAADDSPAPDTPPAGTGEATVELAGRIIRVQMPSAEQLVMWQRIATRVGQQTADPQNVDVDRLMKMLDQVITIIRTVMVDPADGDWLEDEMLAGRLGFEKAAGFVAEAITLLRGTVKPAAPTTGPVVRRRR